MENKPTSFKAQQQTHPGKEEKMFPKPGYIQAGFKAEKKLEGKKALAIGGYSGIGRVVAVHFDRESAEVPIVYLNEADDASPAYVLLASVSSSYITDQIIHVIGGEVFGG